MGKLIRSFLLAVLLSGLVALVEPPLRMALYTARLTTLPVPERLPIPVDRVRPETLRNSWHAERAAGRRHEGIDIFAPRGTPVRATTEGVIVRIGDGGLGGRTVWVLGPGGQRHYYAHLERFADIFRGQRVARRRSTRLRRQQRQCPRNAAAPALRRLHDGRCDQSLRPAGPGRQ